MAKHLLYLLIIISKLLNISTNDHIESENINKILDTLIKQAENSSQHGGVVIDKVENKTNDSSKIIYLKPKDTARSALPADNDYSEEIIVEMEESFSDEMEKGPNMNHITSSYNTNQSDKLAKNNEELNSYIAESQEDPEEKEYRKNMPGMKNNNKITDPASIMDAIETLKKHTDEITMEKLKRYIDGRILPRTVVPTDDTGKVNEDNPYSLKNILRSGYPLNMPSNDQLQSLIPQNLLTQTLQDEASMNLKYLQNFVPAFVSPSPGVIRTVIQQSGVSYHPHSHYPGEWLLPGPTCCIS